MQKRCSRINADVLQNGRGDRVVFFPGGGGGCDFGFLPVYAIYKTLAKRMLNNLLFWASTERALISNCFEKSPNSHLTIFLS